MEETSILEQSCKFLGIEIGSVPSWKVYEDRIILIVDYGIAGSKKVTVMLSSLPTSAVNAEKPVVAEIEPVDSEPEVPIAHDPVVVSETTTLQYGRKAARRSKNRR